MTGIRAIDFMVPFWGKRYRDYFVELCLPSLLAPGNLPLLAASDGHRFLIATTREDWQAIVDLPIMVRLRRHAEPVWIEIGEANPGDGEGRALVRYSATIRRQNDAQKKLVSAAYEARSYASLIFPDVIYSDGMVASLIKSVEAGDHLVLCMALRQTEERVLEELAERGLVRKDAPFSATAQSLTVPQRLAARLAVKHLHPEITAFDGANPASAFIRPFTYRLMQAPDSLVLRTFFGVPALMDCRVLRDDHSACLDRGMFEVVYLDNNFSSEHRVRVVRDSDEFSLISLTPEMVNWSAGRRQGSYRPRWFREYYWLSSFQGSRRFFGGSENNSLRDFLYNNPIYWHGCEIDESWSEEDRLIQEKLDRSADSFAVRLFVGAYLRLEVIRARLRLTELIRQQLGLALKGDAGARARLARGLRVLLLQLFDPTNDPGRRRNRGPASADDAQVISPLPVGDGRQEVRRPNS